MPELAAVSFLLICGVIVAFGGVQSARRTSHAMGVWILRGVQLIPLLGPTVSDAAIALTKLIAHELGEYAVPKIQQLVRFVAGLGQYVAVVGYWSLLWPIELYHVVSWLVHRAVPQRVRAETLPLEKIARMAAALVKPLPAKIIHAAKAVPAVAKTVVIQTVPRSVREAAREIEWLRRHWKALTAAVAGAGAIALPWGGAGRIARDVLGLRKLYHKLSRRTVGLGAAAMVTAALVKMGLGALQCNNVKRALRGTCHANPAWLSLLFGAGAEAWIITHLCEFIAEVGAAAKAIQPELLQFVEIEDALIGCHGATKPPNLPLSWPTVPVVGEPLTLAV